MSETLEKSNSIKRLRKICETKESETFDIKEGDSFISIRVSFFIACLVCKYYDMLSDNRKDDFIKLGIDRMIDLAVERLHNQKTSPGNHMPEQSNSN